MSVGELLQIALRVEAGLLRAVRLSLVHPEQFTEPQRLTIEALGVALEGAPADLPLAALQTRLQAAIPFGVELPQLPTPELAQALAQAITRHSHQGSHERVGSLTVAEIAERTRSWQGLDWSILPERPLTPAVNVALDEVLLERLARQERGPMLRFWRWSEAAVVLGRTQSVRNEVDVAAATARQMRIVRRLSGGGTMFLQPAGAITYSLYLPERLLHGLTIRQSYEVCDAWVTLGLRELECEAYYVPINDIACSEGKIGGAAQARRGGVVLHHTTLAYDLDPIEMAQVLRIGRPRLRDKGTASAAKRVYPLVRQTNFSRGAVVEQLMANFVERFGGQIDQLGVDELQAAQQLAHEKYETDAWTFEYD